MRKKIFHRLLFFVLAALFPLFGNAQILSSTLTSTHDSRQTFAFTFTIDSEGKNLNAIEAYISYPTDLIEVVDVIPENSVVDLWVSKPRIDQVKHEIVLIGGIAGGAVMRDASLVTVFAKTIASGAAQFSLDTARSGVYLNDGSGTRISLSATDIHTTISVNQYEPSARIESPSHPDEFTWYPISTAVFAWETDDKIEWSYALEDDPSATVDATADSPTGNVTFENLSDGVHYFLLRQHIGQATWIAPVTRSVRVDTTPPEAFEVAKVEDNPQYNGKTMLVFQTTDAISGIARYVVEDDRETYEVDRGPVELRNPNSALIQVIAFDEAGNSTVARLEASVSHVQWPWSLLIIVVAFLVIVLIFWASRKKYQKTHQA